MTTWVRRLPFTLDPLIAEAKRRMRQRRLVAVALLVGLSGGAAGAVYIEQGSSDGTASPLVQVLVAKRVLVYGTTSYAIRSGLYRFVRIPKSGAEAGALVNLASLTGNLALNRDIASGEQLTRADFTRFTPIPGPQRAALATVGAKVAGQISVGSHVNVLVASSGRAKLHVLFHNMYVLAVLKSGRVALRATTAQAVTLMTASKSRRIRLVLRRIVG